MRISLLFLLVVASVFGACHRKTHEVRESAAYEKFKNTPNDGKHFGENTTATGAMSVQEVSKKMVGKEKMTAIKIQGTVLEVCQNKGCWMTLVNPEGEPIFVRFKDYGFFMPKDLSGQTVVMQGESFYDIVPVDELRHYAEDAGKPQAEIDAITTPKKELRFTATGVLVL